MTIISILFNNIEIYILPIFLLILGILFYPIIKLSLYLHKFYINYIESWFLESRLTGIPSNLNLVETYLYKQRLPSKLTDFFTRWVTDLQSFGPLNLLSEAPKSSGWRGFYQYIDYYFISPWKWIWTIIFIIYFIRFLLLFFKIIRLCFIFIKKIIISSIKSGPKYFFYNLLHWIMTPWLKRLEKRRILRYYWVKHEISYRRFTHYLWIIFLQSLFYFFFINFFLHPQSYWQVAGEAQLDDPFDFLFSILLPAEEDGTLYDMLGIAQKIDFLIFTLGILYHIWFWITFLFKRIYLYKQQHPEAFHVTIFAICWIKNSEIMYFFIEDIYVIGYNIFTYGLIWSFWFWMMFVVTEENEMIYDLTLETRNMSRLTWEMQRIWYEFERYEEARVSDLPWEQRVGWQYSKRLGYDLFVSDRKLNVVINRFAKVYKAYQYTKSPFGLTTEQCIHYAELLEEHKRKVTPLSFEQQLDNDTMSAWSPYGKLAVNQFDIFIPFKRFLNFTFVISLPYKNYGKLNYIFHPDTLDRWEQDQLIPFYRFLKNPLYTIKYWEEPLLLAHYTRVPPQEIVRSKYYRQLIKLEHHYWQHRWCFKNLNKQKEFQEQLHLTDYHFGTKKIQWNYKTIYWDNWVYYRPLKLWKEYKRLFYFVNGYSYYSRRKHKDYRTRCFKSFHRRYSFLEKIFFKKRIRKKEFMAKMELEELIRNKGHKRAGIKDRRKLKTRNRRTS